METSRERARCSTPVARPVRIPPQGKVVHDRVRELGKKGGQHGRPKELYDNYTLGSPKMNALELDYADALELRARAGQILGWKFGSVRLHMGGGAWYKPDFFIWTTDGKDEIHETKGYWREAARVRIKVSASKFTLFRFVAVTRAPSGRRKGEWKFEVITP